AVLYAAVEADSDATLIDGKYRTTITLSQFGGCGAGDLTVLLNGNRIGTAAVDMRSPDMIANGAVIISDFTRFGTAYPSPPKPYDACADYRTVLGEVTTGDFTYFGTHFNHNSSGGAMPATAAAEAAGALRLDVQEEYSLAGGRRVWGTLSVENVEPFRALVVALHTDNPRFRFVAWHPDPSYPAMTMGTEVVRDGQRQAFVGILGSAAALSTTPLGKVEFEIMDDEPLALSDDDLSFLVADLQAVEGGLRSLSPLRLERAETPPAYHFELGQNVPNPFNPLTTIAYSLASDSDVSLVVYDVRGARVKTLVSGHTRAGVQRVQWDGVDDRGSRVSSGVYFYRLVAGSFRDTKKMVLLK
ncbi:MAG TPA: FlgD immunoglobulin-like domain containing protein, partial [Candidatus Krumholzibacteria bacterium]|nr:FlgD immunoglobulin-like domain containing protein [Candidatus Krumholzibacteria bacterium]